MEDTAEHRFVIDEHGVVIDNMAYFVYQSLQKQTYLDDDRFSFIMNRVFREYLLDGLPENVYYKPLSITWLLRETDAKSSYYIRERWSPRYSIDLQVEYNVRFRNFSCFVRKKTDTSAYVISKAEESNSETMSCLLAVSALCLQWSSIQLTHKYLKAKKASKSTE